MGRCRANSLIELHRIGDLIIDGIRDARLGARRNGKQCNADYLHRALTNLIFSTGSVYYVTASESPRLSPRLNVQLRELVCARFC